MLASHIFSAILTNIFVLNLECCIIRYSVCSSQRKHIGFTKGKMGKIFLPIFYSGSYQMILTCLLSFKSTSGQ